MRFRRKTNMWHDSRSGISVPKVKLRPVYLGEINLGASYDLMNNSKLGSSAGEIEKVVQHLVQLIEAGYKVKISGLGTMFLSFNCDSFDYKDSKRCGLDSIKGMQLEIKLEKELKKYLGYIKETGKIE